MAERQLPKLNTRVRFPSPAPASSRTSYRSRRRFFFQNNRHLSLTSSLLLSKLNPLRWASIWVFFCKVRSTSFPATACGIAENCVRSLAPPSKSEALGFGFVFLLRAKTAQLRFRQQPTAIAGNCVRSLAPPSKSEALWLRICFFRAFFAPLLLLSKLNPLRWASIWVCLFRKVRSTSFPATACGYCRKLRSLPCASSQIRSTRLRICFFALLFVPLLLLYKLNPRGELWRCKDDQKLRSRRI